MKQNYRDLIVYKKSISFVTQIYKITEKFPSEEKFWIISQIRRASVSISSNIAEGAGRNWNGEFKQFLFIAKSSCYEVETQLLISKNIWFISEEVFTKFNDELI